MQQQAATEVAAAATVVVEGAAGGRCRKRAITAVYKQQWQQEQRPRRLGGWGRSKGHSLASMPLAESAASVASYHWGTLRTPALVRI